jgi:hypothetical protein
MNDTRWKALEDRDRENIFQDYLDYLYDKEKQEKRQRKYIFNNFEINLRKELSEIIRNKLISDPSVNSATRWDDINQKYRDNAAWNELSEYDKLL